MKEIVIPSISEIELKSLIKSAVSEVLREILAENFMQKGIEEDDLIGQKEACRLLMVSTVSLWNWRKEGKINYKKIGRKVYYSKRELSKIDNNTN